jgi:signal transduction histidine kinase
MQSAAARMQQLIEDLLAFSQINLQEINLVNTELSTIVEEVKTELAETIEEKHAVIEATELCAVNIIPFQFRQLMHNLIGNALKFSKTGVPPHIIIKAKTIKGDELDPMPGISPEKHYCHIIVTDNGIGFDPQYNDQIFEVFQRLHEREQFPGTGIGLAIVKKIVQNHSGIITATSDSGKGATFDIFIPAGLKI